jgi:phosphatidylinositol glycan class M
MNSQSLSLGLLAFVPQRNASVCLSDLCIFSFSFFANSEIAVLLLVALALRYARSFLTFCLFAQTFVFVTFNKVCTVQYFIWYWSLLPLCLPQLRLGLLRALIYFVAWFGAQVNSFLQSLAPPMIVADVVAQLLWLNFAYQLEFLGENTFLEVWFAGLLFFAVNIYILFSCVVSVGTIPSETKK